MLGDIIFPEESYAIMGACFKVHNEMGSGFSEPVYQECLMIEFELSGVPSEAQQEIGLAYRERRLRSTFRPDFVCYEKIVLEIKALSALCGEHRAQVINYLKATGHQLGLLVNFGKHPRLEYERLVLTPDRGKPRITRLGDDGRWLPVQD